jgi:hypothetical protein
MFRTERNGKNARCAARGIACATEILRRVVRLRHCERRFAHICAAVHLQRSFFPDPQRLLCILPR